MSSVELAAKKRLKDVYNIIVLGNTGVGKSALLNMFAGQDVYTVGESATSETQIAWSNVYPFMGKGDGVKLRLVDTQGLSDSGGDTKDMENIKQMVDYVRNIGHIDLFLLCLDGQNPRLTSYAKSTISLFRQIFPDFLYHTVLVFNKWTSPSEDKRKALKGEYQARFSADFDIPSIPCYFIDSYFNRKMLRDNDNSKPSVRRLHPDIQERTKSQVVELMGYLVLKDTVCDVRRIQAVNTEIARLTKEIESAKNEAERLRLENEANARRIEESFGMSANRKNFVFLSNIDRILEAFRKPQKDNIIRKFSSFFG